MKNVKKIAVVTLILSSVVLTGCGLKVGFGFTQDPKCTWLCSG